MSHDPSAESRILDVEHLRDVCGGDLEFEREILGDFVAQIGPMLEGLARAVASGDPGTIRFAAHALKGSSRSLGAIALAEVCAELEEGTHGIASAPELLGRAAAEVERLRERIRRHLQDQAA